MAKTKKSGDVADGTEAGVPWGIYFPTNGRGITPWLKYDSEGADTVEPIASVYTRNGAEIVAEQYRDRGYTDCYAAPFSMQSPPHKTVKE